MTMHPSPTMGHLSRDQYDATKSAVTRSYATLATKWGVDAVGREYPNHVTRANGYRFVRPGKWYVVRDGKRYRASASQARSLNRVGTSGVASIAPVAAS
jgi:hypothetical protein